MSTLEVEDNQWGVVKNGEFIPLTNFVFNILYAVNADSPGNSGYLAQLRRCIDGMTGAAWFRFQDTVGNKELIKALNDSFAGRRLFSNLNKQQITTLLRNQDAQLSETSDKRLATFLGIQDDGTLILSPDLCLNKDHVQQNQDDCMYIWVPEWPSTPPLRLARTIQMPVSMEPLHDFLSLAIRKFANNAPQVVLSVAAMIACGNYEHIIETTGHFNTPLLTGPVMCGKTLTATCAAFIFGCSRGQILSRSTLPFLTDQFTLTTLPFVWDDPSMITDVQQVVVDLGNGAMRGRTGLVGTPKTACLITANFDMGQDLRYSTRVFQIRFKKLQKVKIPGEGAMLEDSARAASAALPLVLGLGKVSKDELVEEMNLIGEGQHQDIRQLEGAAVPLAICRKMLEATGIDFMEDVIKYCNGAIHNQVRSGKEVEVQRAEDSLVTLLKKVSNEEKPALLRLTGGHLYIKSVEFHKTVKTNFEEVKKYVTKLQGKTSVSFRIPVTAKNGSRCYTIPVTSAIKKAVNMEDELFDLQTQGEQVQLAAQGEREELPDEQLAHASPVRGQGPPPATQIRDQQPDHANLVEDQGPPPATPIQYPQPAISSPVQEQQPASSSQEQRPAPATPAPCQRPAPASQIQEQEQPPASPVGELWPAPASPVREEQRGQASPVRQQLPAPASQVQPQCPALIRPVREQQPAPASPAPDQWPTQTSAVTDKKLPTTAEETQQKEKVLPILPFPSESLACGLTEQQKTREEPPQTRKRKRDKYTAGDKVNARWGRKTYPAKIVAVTDKSIKVMFESDGKTKVFSKQKAETEIKKCSI